MEQNKCKVTASEAGTVINASVNNPEFGYIRVVQNRIIVNEEGWAKPVMMSAIIPGTVKDLTAFGWHKDQEVDGKIIFKESLTPFNKKNPEKDLKIAGDTGIICVKDGQSIYRKYFFTTNLKAEDVVIAHTNGDDIRAAYLALKNKEAGVSSAEKNFALDA